MPVFCFFWPSRFIFPSKGKEDPDAMSFPWSIHTKVDSIDSIYCRAGRVLSDLLTFSYGYCKRKIRWRWRSDDQVMTTFPPGRLAFKEEGAGKVRVFVAIPNALKQALLRPAHDWCMKILRMLPTDGTFNQTAPLGRLSKLKSLRSFDLSSATDRFPLAIQGVLIEALFNLTNAFAWVRSGLGVNAFKAPTDEDQLPCYSKLVRFATGQPLGFLSSWPLFALCHHFFVWYSADRVYPGRKFKKYALLGDDIVIGDSLVAKVYQEVMTELGVGISAPKSWISERGGLEFAKKFRIQDRDLSPISVKMLRSARHAVAWMPVCQSVGVTSLRTSLRLRGAGFRRYSSRPEHVNPNYNRHWFRHILITFSPGGITPLPFNLWLSFPEGFLVTPYHMGMVRQMLLESCSPDWDFMVRLVEDLDPQLDEDTLLFTETILLKQWMEFCLEYMKWYSKAKIYFSITAIDLLDPPAVVFRPDRKDKFSTILKQFRCYDLIRTHRAPLPLTERGVSLHIDLVQCKLWLKPCQWLGKVFAAKDATRRSRARPADDKIESASIVPLTDCGL